MRRYLWLVLAGLAGTTMPALPAAAEPPVEAAEAVEAPTRWDALSAAVGGELGALFSAATGEDRIWVERLVGLYDARGGRAIWAQETGFKPAARTAADELSRADQWGLDARTYRVPDLEAAGSDAKALARAEVGLSLAVLKYVAHARGHRVDPSQLSKWLDQRPRPVAAWMVGLIADSEEPAAALRALHPQHAGFERLRQAWLKVNGGAGRPAAEPKIANVKLPGSGTILRPGTRHEDVELLRQRLGIKAAPHGVTSYDDDLVEAVRGFQRQAGLAVDGVVNAKVRRALNGALNANAVNGSGASADQKLMLVNMERWRWIPEQLGATHVWNNLPEFQTRVLRDGAIAFQERIIIGKPETQTPIFSDRMRYVVFKPDWALPGSIKVKDLLPRLQDGDSNVLAKRGMKIVINGREKDPDDIDWDKVDIRNVPIVQGPGSANPLGQVKFMFPNKHDVYMHDTPSKGLFNETQRTFSHGCIRVRNPRQLAELVFGMDKGWGGGELDEVMGRAGPENNKVDLNRTIDVHNVYFTLVVEEDGTLRKFRDIYGHDSRIQRALDGVPAEVIARDDPALRHEESVADALPDSARRRESATRGREAVSAFDWRPPGARAPQRQRVAPPPPRTAYRGPPVRYYSWGF